MVDGTPTDGKGPAVLHTHRGDYQLAHLMHWADREQEPQPSVPLVRPETRIAAIGSCFARRVTEVLSARGLNAEFHPADRQYNTFSLAQEFDHLFGDEDPYSEDDVCEASPGRWVHPFRRGLRAHSRKALLREQRVLDEKARRLYRRADLIIITLGLTEIWERVSDGRVAVVLPPLPLYEAGVFRFRQSTTAENLANLNRMYERLRRVTAAPLLLTVSPVPLGCTFRPDHVVVANCESKCILRAAVADFLADHDDVHYFRSFELTPQWSGKGAFFLDDGRHISPQGVNFIMNAFLRQYGSEELRPAHQPLGRVAMPDQAVHRRFIRRLRSHVQKGMRHFKRGSRAAVL